MALGWKILIPFSIIWMLLVATCGRCAPTTTRRSCTRSAGVVLVLFVLLITFWDNGYQKHLARLAPEPAGRGSGRGRVGLRRGRRTGQGREAVQPRFPVPPLDLPHYHGLELCAIGASRCAGTPLA